MSRRSRPLTEADVKALQDRARGVKSLAKATTPRKFRNVPTEYAGLSFGSGKEAQRAQALMLLAKAGLITELELDKRKLRYPLIVNGAKIGTYTPDAVYHERGMLIIEDVKSEATRKTPWYRRTKKLMKALYNIDIREV